MAASHVIAHRMMVGAYVTCGVPRARASDDPTSVRAPVLLLGELETDALLTTSE